MLYYNILLRLTLTHNDSAAVLTDVCINLSTDPIYVKEGRLNRKISLMSTASKMIIQLNRHFFKQFQ